MNKLAYLLPRLLLLATIAIGVCLVADPLAKHALTTNFRAATGAELEIGQIRVRSAAGKAFLHDLAIVSAESPRVNLFQADLALLEFEASPLWGRKLVVDSARASQVRFNAPRLRPLAVESANFSKQKESKSEAPVNAPVGQEILFTDSAEQLRLQWMDQFQSRQDAAVPRTNGNIEAMAQSKASQWQDRLGQQRRAIEQLVSELHSLGSDSEAENAPDNGGFARPRNPLRDARQEAVVSERIESLVQSINAIEQQQQSLRKMANDDLKHLDDVWQSTVSQVANGSSDHELNAGRPVSLSTVENKSGVDPAIASETFSRLLLTELHQQIVTDAMQWFGELRTLPICPQGAACDSIATDFANAASGRRPGRGENLLIGDTLPSPTMVLKKLVFDGEGHLQNQHVNFVGEVNEISDQPQTHDLPITFRARAQGEQHFEVEGSFDRRDGKLSDQMVFEMPDYRIGSRTLGTKNEMMLTLSPGTKLRGSIELRMDGDKLTGKTNFDFLNVAMVVDNVHPLAGGNETRIRLNQSVSAVDTFRMDGKIGGTWNRPEAVLKSNLGGEIAEAIRQIHVMQRKKQLLASRESLQEIRESKIESLAETIESELTEIDRIVAIQVDRARKIQATMMSAKSRWPEVR